MTPVRIAILDCDSLTPKLCEKYGNYGSIVARWLDAGARNLGFALDVYGTTSWDVMGKNELSDANGIDAIIVTGSNR